MTEVKLEPCPHCGALPCDQTLSRPAPEAVREDGRPLAGFSRETLGKAIYLALYGPEGAVWEANETPHVWWAAADRLARSLAASPSTPPAPGCEGEAVAWMYEWRVRDHAEWSVELFWEAPDPADESNWYRNVTPLYASPLSGISAAKTALTEIASLAGDGRRTANLPVIARKAHEALAILKLTPTGADAEGGDA